MKDSLKKQKEFTDDWKQAAFSMEGDRDDKQKLLEEQQTISQDLAKKLAKKPWLRLNLNFNLKNDKKTKPPRITEQYTLPFGIGGPLPVVGEIEGEPEAKIIKPGESVGIEEMIVPGILKDSLVRRIFY